MEIVENDLSVETSKSFVIVEDSDNVEDESLQLIAEEFKYLEILV